MRCSSCDSQIPDDAAFCINCGTPVAATGRTVTLDQRGPVTVPPVPDLPAPPPRPAAGPGGYRGAPVGRGRRRARGVRAKAGGVFLIGLGVLLLTGAWWPWVLALFGVTSAIEEFGRGRARKALATLLFLAGLAALLATGTLWPGILVLVGLVVLIDRTGC